MLNGPDNRKPDDAGCDDLLPYRVVSPDEMAAWPVDRKRSERTTWSELAWGEDNAVTEENAKLFNWNIWPNRVVFEVVTPAGAAVARAEAVWRRSTLSIRLRGLKLLHAESGTLVQDVRLIHYDQERVSIDFRPIAGNGRYDLYYGAAEVPYFDPAPEWATLSIAAKDPPRAIPRRIEARCALDSFYPMEVVALAAEKAALLAAYPEASYLVFPEDRDRPIRLRTELPVHWAQKGPAPTLVLHADRNEYRVFQLGVWACRADLPDVQVNATSCVVTDLHSPNGVIPARRIQCLTLESRARHLYMGRPTPPFATPQGEVRALWFGIDLPPDCAPGEYTGAVVVQPLGHPATSVTLHLHVSDVVVPEKGDHDLWRLSRLRWLESEAGLSDAVYTPFAPLVLSDDRRILSTWGHTFVLDSMGLIQQVRAGAEDILDAPVALQTHCAGQPVVWKPSAMDIVEHAPDHITWHGQARAGALHLTIEGRLEFDGSAVLTLDVGAEQHCVIESLALILPWRIEHAELATGMGYRGKRVGDRTWRLLQRDFEYGPCVWLGSMRAGLGWLTESGEPWEEPARVDAATIQEHDGAVTLQANFGAHTVGPDRPWRLRFALLPTPVRPPDPRHWQFRYMHVGGDFRPGDNDTPQSFLRDECQRLEEAKAIGVRRLNLHDWWGPAFNYPWQWEDPDNETASSLARLTAEAHKRGLYVKVYNSGRELSTLAPEFWALVEEASRGQVSAIADPHLARQRFHDAWHENHLPDDFAQGWPRLSPGYGNEHSVVVGCAHRYGNFYLESVRYMTRFFGTDGAYWDGAEYPYPSWNRNAGFGYIDHTGVLRPTLTYLAARELAKRMWVMLRQEKPEATIDSHHGNTLLTSPTAEHMLCLPFIDSIWHGEGYDYDRLDPWAWLVEIAGLPFGVPSELLAGEEYIGRAMLFGIWPRAGWCAGTEKQRRLWAFFDYFGIQDAAMIGWWETPAAVVGDRPETYVTAFAHPLHGVLLAISSWHPPIAQWIGQPIDVSLLLDRPRLGLTEGLLTTTDILTDEMLDITQPIPLAHPPEGRLLWVRADGE